jgi:hypothetical protein
VIGCALLATKRRIVSREAEDGDALPQRCLPENEGKCVKRLASDSNHGSNPEKDFP